MNTVILFVILGCLWVGVQSAFHLPHLRGRTMTKILKSKWTVARGAFFAVAAIAAIIATRSWVTPIASSLGGLFLFAALFPITINMLMKWHPFYLGGTSDWDAWMISLFVDREPDDVKRKHDHDYKDNEFYADLVHTAGLVAMIAVLGCAAMCFYIAYRNAL